MNLLRTTLLLTTLAGTALAQPPETGTPLDPRALEIRDRYEQVLTRDPFQESAFDRVYESYMLSEGVDAWVATLASPADTGVDETPEVYRLILRGRILARQLKTEEAIEAFEAARDRGETRPELNLHLGRLYYESGQDDNAITLLGAALESVGDPDERSALCRILGNVYLRSGRRDEAAAVWQRIVESSPDDFFALQELAEIQSDNKLWAESIATWERIAALAQDDPYRRCQALRAIGQAHVASDQPAEAIAAFEAALDLAAPGNWLFDDLKGRLVAVYESRGDLDGLTEYLQARFAQHPGELAWGELLADTRLRRGDSAGAETVLQELLARAPDRASTYELLLRLYTGEQRVEDVTRVYKTLIDRYPLEPDYLRRLGEFQLQQGQSAQALETWHRAGGDGTDPETVALVAEWLERYEFFPEAAAAYARALALRPNRDWQLRLAALHYDMGEEDEALAAWLATTAADDTPPAELAEVAGILLTHEFVEAAQGMYERALAEAPENLDYVLALARLQAGRADHAAAATYYAQLAEQNDNAYYQSQGEQGLLEAYAQLGTLAEHQTAWETAVATQPDAIAPRLKLARLYTRSGNRPGAVKLYEECVRIEPDSIEHQRNLAEAYRLNRQDGRAVETLQRLMTLDPPRAPGYLRDLLKLYESGGETENAVAAAEQLVALTPANPEARAELARVYLRHGPVEKALQQLRNAIQLRDDEPAYYRELGDALARTDRFGEAREVYQKMLDVARDKTARMDALGRLADVHARIGQGDALIAEYRARVATAPKNLDSYEELAAVYRALGQPTAAMDALESARGLVEDTAAVLRLVLADAYSLGDYVRVVSVYDELLALSGQPDRYDLDRLAEACARSGDLDRAIEVWEGLAASHTSDPAAQVLVAKALQRNGYYEQAWPYMERALDLDPYDYGLRFEYAQELLQFGLAEEGGDQLRRILDIGERPAAEGAPATQQGPPATRPNAAPHPVAFQGTLVRGRHGGGYTGQSFAEFRGVVLQNIVQAARQAGDGDAAVDEFRKVVEEQPENVDARFDYVLVCEFAGKHEEALESTLKLQEIYPEDVQLQWRALQFQRQLNRTDDAIQTANRLAEHSDPGVSREALLTLVSLHLQAGQTEQADAVMARLTTGAPDDARVYLRLAHAVQYTPRSNEAVAFFQKAAEIDPTQRQRVDDMLAQLYRRNGDIDNARTLFEAVLFADPGPSSSPPRSRQNTTLYMPQWRHADRRSSGNLSQLPGARLPAGDHQKIEAFNQLVQLSLDDVPLDPVIERLRTASEAYGAAESAEAITHAATYVQIYVAYLRNTGETEAALATVEGLLAQRPGDDLLTYLELYLLDDLGRYDVMAERFDAIEAKSGAGASELAQARLHLAMAMGDTEHIPVYYRALVTSGGSNRYLTLAVQALEDAGAGDQALTLLKEAVAASRDADTVAQLSRAYSRAGQHDDSIALAWEAWQLQAGAGTRLGPRSGASGFSEGDLTLHALGLQHLLPLWNAYNAAGRTEALSAAFEEKLQGQPNALALRQALVGLYCQERRWDRAREVMGALASLRPNDLLLKRQYAQVLESAGDPAAALQVLEEAARGRQRSARDLNRAIQRLYKELNRPEALAEMRERLVHEARSTDELLAIARDLSNDGDHEAAAGVAERAYRRETENLALLYTAGDYRWQAGQTDEALDAFRRFIEQCHAGGNTRLVMQRIPSIIDRFDTSGQLDTLRTLAEAPSADSAASRVRQFLTALIARHESRFDEAVALLAPLAEDGNDLQIIGILADIAEQRGDYGTAIAHVKKMAAQQPHGDYTRLAKLYLASGDTAAAIEYWQKQALAQGVDGVHSEALRSLLNAGAQDEAEDYYRRVIAAIPAGEWVFRELASILIGEHLKSGAFGDTISDVVFAKETTNTEGLLQELTSDYHVNPHGALARIRPIAARLPESAPVHLQLSHILERLRDYAGAAAALRPVMADERYRPSNINRYLNLLERAGLPAERVAFARELLAEETTPLSGTIQAAAHAVQTTADPATLFALQDETLARAKPEEHVRIRANFARSIAAAGDVWSARDALRAWFEAMPGEGEGPYLSFLRDWGFYEEAATLYLERNASGGEIAGPYQDIQVFGEILVASGRVAEACDLVHRTRQAHGPHGGFSGSGFVVGSGISALVAQLRDYNASAFAQRVVAEKLGDPGNLTLDEQFYLADYRTSFGDPKALEELMRAHPNNHSVLGAAQVISMHSGTFAFSPSNATLWQVGGPLAAAHGITQSDLQEAREALASGNREGAVQKLDAMRLGARATSQRLDRARIYLEAGAVDKSVADCRAALEQQPDNQEAALQLAIGLVHGDQAEKGLALWRDLDTYHIGEGVRALAAALADRGLHEAALEVLSSPRYYGNRNSDEDMLVARILHDTGQIDAMVSALEERYRSRFVGEEQRFEERYGAFLIESGSWRDVLPAEVIQGAGPALTGALLNAGTTLYGQGDVEGAAAVAEALKGATPDRATHTLSLARLLQSLERRDAALEVLGRFNLDNISESWEATDLVQLYMDLAAWPEAAVAMNSVSARYPEHLNRADTVVRIVARAGDTEAATALWARFQQAAWNDTRRQYNNAWLAAERDGANTALPAYEMLVDAPELHGEGLLHIAALLREQGRSESALRALQRVYESGDYGNFYVDRALAEAAAIHAEGGHYLEAVRLFARMLPARQEATATAYSAIMAHIDVLPCAEIDGFVRDTLATDSDHPSIPQLLALRAKIAELQQVTLAPIDLAAAGMSPQSTYDTALWTHLIDRWWIKPIAHTEGPGTDAIPLDASLAAILRGEPGAAAALEDGVVTTPGQVYPTASVALLQGSGEGAGVPSGTLYGLAEITSPDARAITLAHGSKRPSRIWVNGTEVFASAGIRNGIIDQDLIAANLDTGVNRILVGCGNAENPGAFSLSIVEGGNGLVVRAPDAGVSLVP